MLHRLDHTELKMEALVGGPTHAGVHIGQTIHHTQELFGGCHLALRLDLLGNFRLEVFCGGLRVCLADKQRAYVLNQV